MIKALFSCDKLYRTFLFYQNIISNCKILLRSLHEQLRLIWLLSFNGLLSRLILAQRTIFLMLFQITNYFWFQLVKKEMFYGPDIYTTTKRWNTDKVILVLAMISCASSSGGNTNRFVQLDSSKYSSNSSKTVKPKV